jgi:hypothetical protein
LKKIFTIGTPVLAIAFCFAACSDIVMLSRCGDEKEFSIVLTAEEIKTYPESKPDEYGYGVWYTIFPSTNIGIILRTIEDVCVESPVQISFEASCNIIPYEGDLTISGTGGAAGGLKAYDLILTKETTDEILFAKDTVLDLVSVDFRGEKPSFYTGVIFEVSTGNLEDDMAYFYKLFNQFKVTVKYKASKE